MWVDENGDMRRKGSVRGDKAPQTYTKGEWPHDAVPQPDAPLPVHYSLTLARTLDDLCARRGLSHRALSLAAGIAPNAVGRIVRGELYPDLATLARLEAAAEEPIYPYRAYLTLRRLSE
ncbi:helix-turn-helix transcriptional regulator [Nocardia sp. NPDC050793]|uniref:helix-turn-helix domain-containing protein n=1 Tax=Nocardia sp. NPDC050793 TaxID=3155159 RepID=UPI0033DC0F17